ncbi:MAG: hypothetical protein OXH04_22610 [Acidobacteria bacterium]|nr:hypothetical protein [Acidobacteriota bacterium]
MPGARSFTQRPRRRRRHRSCIAAKRTLRPRFEGPHEFEVAEGDILHVPARSWHQVVVPEGGSITYALIIVFE